MVNWDKKQVTELLLWARLDKRSMLLYLITARVSFHKAKCFSRKLGILWLVKASGKLVRRKKF